MHSRFYAAPGRILVSWFLLLFVTWSTSTMAQPRAELGVRVAGPVRGPMPSSDTRTFTDNYHVFSSAPRHISFGASASFPIFQRVRLRLDPAYQRIGATSTALILSDIGANVIKQGIAANRWRVPILLESAVARHLRLGIGPELSVLTGSHTIFEQRHPSLHIGPSTVDFPPGKPDLFGIAAALEFPFLLSPVIVAPEIRYTRWTGKHYGGIWAMDELTVGVAIRH